jgi:photosystem I P700 chlorophyll a apoprotein A2
LVHYNPNTYIQKVSPICIRFNSDTLNELSDVVPANRNTLIGRCATNKYFQVLGSIHDIESYNSIDHTSSYNVQIFLCHWGHLAIIFVWVSRNLFHIGWNGNYELWEQNPIDTLPIADGIWDPHFGLSKIRNNIAYNGIYTLLYTLGLNSVVQLYNLVLGTELLGAAWISLAFTNTTHLDSLAQWVRHHQPLPQAIGIITIKPPSQRFTHTNSLGSLVLGLSIWPFKLVSGIMHLLEGGALNFHTGTLIGFLSIAWGGHLLHLYIIQTDIVQHLTFHGGLKSNTISLYLTDIAHHHLGVGILFVLAPHSYTSLYKGFGHRIGDVLFVHLLGRSQATPIALSLNKSLHLQLSIGCTGLAYITSVVAQHIYCLRPYLYLSYDYITTAAIYCNHQYIASLLMMATLGHARLFLIRDYTNPPPNMDMQYAVPENGIGGILKMKAQFISHLSWICLYLGFHTLGSYIHNDTVVAFGSQGLQIAGIPVFASLIQETSSNIMPLGSGDLLVHHAIALGLHVTILIQLKGTSDARGSKLMPDKIHFAVSFACDGPIRGGTCDISAWDSNYLALFWMLNTGAWITLYFHWKQECVENGPPAGSTYLNGWFRDYLWQNSTPLMNGYNTLGANDLSILSWAFLGAHLCWPTGFMFLISWRGYWQELIDIILLMHLKTPILYNLWNGDITAKPVARFANKNIHSLVTPIALSIVQARFVGVVHFSIGFILTYAAFIVGPTN